MKTVALIACSAAKQPHTCEARLLYKGREFVAAYELACLCSDEQFILSSKHGLLRPTDVIAPYNDYLGDKKAPEKKLWAESVCQKLVKLFDVNNTHFIILAGGDYYKYLLEYLPHHEIPLKNVQGNGIRPKYLKNLANIIRSGNMCEQLHSYFNSLPRYNYATHKDVTMKNGIYIMFEKNEYFKTQDRIVRIGTHTAEDRLIPRLKDHYFSMNKDGSVFRKNIGKAILNKRKDAFLQVWNIDTSKSDNKSKLTKAESDAQKAIEQEVSDYMQSNIMFACIEVLDKGDRLRLEEGIIAALNSDEAFQPGPNWLGLYHPLPEISKSGLWLTQGLNGQPLSYTELENIKSGKYSRVSVGVSVQPVNRSPQKLPQQPKAARHTTQQLSTSEIIAYIERFLDDKARSGANAIEITSKEIHTALELSERYPMVCSAMRQVNKYAWVQVYAPPKGNGARLKHKYLLK